MEDLIHIQLTSHGLLGSDFSSPEEVIQHYGCMQSQDIGQALWVIGSRTENSTEKVVKEACIQGKIIRTWPMRGTLHYMDPRHVRWMLGLCASKTLKGFAKRRAFLWISDSDAEKALRIMEESLRWGKTLTRTELGTVLKENGIPMQTQWTYHLACYAATCWLICFGPPTEKEETFVLLDEWIPAQPELTHEEKLSKLARMYIRGHWPATADDLAWWCGIGKTECKKAIALIEKELSMLVQNGKTYYYFESEKKWTSGLRLLGGFDEYFLGYKDRTPVADLEHHGKLFTVNGIFFPLIVQDGRVIGSWKRIFKKDTVIFTSEVLTWYKVNSEEMKKQCARYAKFFWYEKYKID